MNDTIKQSQDDLLDSVARAHRLVSGEPMGDKEIAVLLRVNSIKLMHLLSKRLEPVGLNANSYIGMMTLIGSSQSQLNPSELAARTGETRANMTRICDDLVARGLMQRTADPHDRRRVNLSLSEAGLALIMSLQPEFKVQVSKNFEIFDKEEKDLLIRLLSRLNQHLDKQL